MAFTFFQRLTDSGDRNIRINATDIDGVTYLRKLSRMRLTQEIWLRVNRKKIKKGGFFL